MAVKKPQPKKRIRKPKPKKERKMDPRQTDFLIFYMDPKSETRGNALQSALKAGYKQEYAESITALMPDWLSENIGKREAMLLKAERNLNEVLDIEHIVPAMGPFGPIIDKKTKKPYMKVSTSILKLKQDTSHFIAETVGKKYYSKRTELTGADGEKLMPEEKEKIDAIFNENTKK